MPTTVINSTNRPSYVTNPDVRYATTMLSAEYRDYAVHGEAIMDKSTGELFIKRPGDGKVVSFFQNKKYTHDLVLELRILLTNNEEFQYPRESETAFYVTTDYDLVAINDEVSTNILKSDSVILNDADNDLRKLHFKLSTSTNGFFCRPTSRDTDKPVIEFLTNQYNKFIRNYAGSDEDCLAEKSKMDLVEKWADSNAVLNYTVEIKDVSNTRSYAVKDYIRINEEVCVLLPITDINVDFPDGYTSATVTVNSITYDKIHFILNHKSLLDPSFETEMKKFLETDAKVLMNNFNVIRFVDDTTDIELFGNEFIVATLDMPYVSRYMSKLAKLKDSSEFIQSTVRPSDDDWSANTVWAERVRDVMGGGVVIDRNTEVDLDALEEHIASQGNTKRLIGIVVTDENDNENFFSDETKQILNE